LVFCIDIDIDIFSV